MHGDILDLFGEGGAPVLPAILPPQGLSDSPMAQRFESFHLANPHVYDSVVRIARELKGHGFRCCGMKLIFERLRWLYAIQTRGDSYQLNNDYTAFYSRVVMLAEPDLTGFFEVRVQKDPYAPDLVALGVPR